MPSVIAAIGKLLLGALVVSSGQPIQQCPAGQQPMDMPFIDSKGNQRMVPTCAQRTQKGLIVEFKVTDYMTKGPITFAALDKKTGKARILNEDEIRITPAD